MEVSLAKKSLKRHYTDDVEWMYAWCDEYATKYKDFNGLNVAYNIAFAEYAIRNLKENYPNVREGIIYDFWKYEWKRNISVIDNLYEFEDYNLNLEDLWK